eukprot:jgi/Undpi1/11540/HiC_scaffold_30.g13837.m1
MGNRARMMGFDVLDSIDNIKHFSDLETHLRQNFFPPRRYLSLGVLPAVAEALEATIVVWVRGPADTLVVHRSIQQGSTATIYSHRASVKTIHLYFYNSANPSDTRVHDWAATYSGHFELLLPGGGLASANDVGVTPRKGEGNRKRGAKTSPLPHSPATDTSGANLPTHERQRFLRNNRRAENRRRRYHEDTKRNQALFKTMMDGAAPRQTGCDVDNKPGMKRMRQKLEGAQFRMINETLYTSESGASLAKFKDEPDLFDVYHRGFREQVEKWPVHPLDVIIEWVRKHPKARIADFGCGEARLAATVPNKVFSFDLVSPNPRVTACDMAHVPLKDASVHLAIFCLSLMGTNLADFLREAHRVLVTGGLVKVAEVRSRFEGEEGGVERFLDVTKRLGFDCRQMDRSNKMFLMAEFKKSNRTPEKGVDFEAKACIYKRR